jgi:hypothetical protein
MLSSQTVNITDNTSVEQSLSSAVVSVTKKVLVDFIKKNISNFSGSGNVQKEIQRGTLCVDCFAF